MKYCIDYKYLPKGAKELVEIGDDKDIEIDDGKYALIPNTGDYVAIPGDRAGNNIGYRGRVHHRFFRYVFGFCYVSVVLEETSDADWAALGRG